MNTKRELARFALSEKLRELRAWSILLAVSVLVSGAVYYYFYAGKWNHEIVQGVVTNITAQQVDEGHRFTIEIDLGERHIWIYENYPPDIVLGDNVNIRVSTREDGNAKYKYFRLRNTAN